MKKGHLWEDASERWQDVRTSVGKKCQPMKGTARDSVVPQCIYCFIACLQKNASGMDNLILRSTWSNNM